MQMMKLRSQLEAKMVVVGGRLTWDGCLLFPMFFQLQWPIFSLAITLGRHLVGVFLLCFNGLLIPPPQKKKLGCKESIHAYLFIYLNRKRCSYSLARIIYKP